MWDLVGNPEDRFSHNEARIYILFAEDIKSKFDDQESDPGSDVGEQGHPEAGNYPIDTPPLSPIELKPDLPPYFPAIQGCRNVEEFSCLNRIEEGTYGVVYRAKDKKTGKFAGKTKELGIFKATSSIRLDPSAKSTKIQTKIKVCNGTNYKEPYDYSILYQNIILPRLRKYNKLSKIPIFVIFSFNRKMPFFPAQVKFV